MAEKHTSLQQMASMKDGLVAIRGETSVGGTTSTPFRLRDLPAELRNQVYACCLKIPGGLILATYGTSEGWQIKIGTIQNGILNLNLLLVSRQINQEATPILYGENSFTFMSPVCYTHSFLKNLGNTSLAHIREIDLGCQQNPADMMGFMGAFCQLRNATSLERLVIHGQSWDEKMMAGLLAPMARSLKEARRGQGKKSVLDILEFPEGDERWVDGVRARLVKML